MTVVNTSRFPRRATRATLTESPMDRRDFLRYLAAGATLVALPDELLAAAPTGARVLPGIDVLERQGFASIKGKRVGLLTHPAGVNARGERSMDVLLRARTQGVRLVKLFGPEHGIYGTEKAEIPIQNTIDRRTGLPVFSLYGKTRKPTPDMLAGLDAMLIDLQDVGCRSYTYVSCMRFVIEACFEAGVQVIVLDRPNPCGGLIVDGPGRDKEFESYVGEYPVPYVHGLTIGELALMATGTSGWLTLSPKAAANGRLTVIPMSGWKRSMRWEHTGLAWRPTSPAIPTKEAAIGYGMTGLGCQLGDFYHGYNGLFQFRWVGHKGRKAGEIAYEFKRAAVPGLDVQPRMMRDGGQGVYLDINDWNTIRPTEISFHMMRIACQWSRKNPFLAASADAGLLFNKHTGSRAWFQELRTKGAGADVKGFVARWVADCNRFKAQRAKFLLPYYS